MARGKTMKTIKEYEAQRFSFWRSKLSLIHLKYILLILGILMRSIFKATLEIIAGIMLFLGLGALLFYLNEKGIFEEVAFNYMTGSLTNIITFIQDNFNL